LYPAENARTIKTLTGTNVDGSYYINVNGTSTLTYCLMDSKWDGGGWMMMMKATNGGFSSSSTLSYPSSFTNSDILVGTISKPSNFVAGTITLTLRAYGGKTYANTMEGGAYVNDVNGTRLVTGYIGDRANNSSSFDITDTVTVSLTDAQFPLTVRSWVWYGGWYINGVTTIITMTGTGSSNGDTFHYDSSYWTDANTTLNPNDTNRNNGDAKFNTMNYMMVKDVMALWPDSGYTGGSIAQADVWSWLTNNYYGGGVRATILTGFSTANSRDSPIGPDPSSFTGFSTAIWSSQSPSRRHVFGGGGHVTSLGSGTPNGRVRWGFLFNENAVNDYTSMDAIGGIGFVQTWGSVYYYSAGDWYGCCGSVGLNRRMRVELYGR
jgi:hypothetical protein